MITIAPYDYPVPNLYWSIMYMLKFADIDFAYKLLEKKPDLDDKLPFAENYLLDHIDTWGDYARGPWEGEEDDLLDTAAETLNFVAPCWLIFEWSTWNLKTARISEGPLANCLEEFLPGTKKFGELQSLFEAKIAKKDHYQEDLRLVYASIAPINPERLVQLEDLEAIKFLGPWLEEKVTYHQRLEFGPDLVRAYISYEPFPPILDGPLRNLR